MTVISRDIEVPMGTLSGWIQEYQEQGEKGFPGSGKIKPCSVFQKDCWILYEQSDANGSC
ncbi:MAG: hypothetical protein C5B45_04225 [Chlamydiae bacterium]|nr:MAG: hypothetical protein C5B45_04225 [Chlamydiota bacterium]